jgi:hypothetical protein
MMPGNHLTTTVGAQTDDTLRSSEPTHSDCPTGGAQAMWKRNCILRIAPPATTDAMEPSAERIPCVPQDSPFGKSLETDSPATASDLALEENKQ